VSPFEDVLFFRPRPHSLDRRIPPLSLRTHGYLRKLVFNLHQTILRLLTLFTNSSYGVHVYQTGPVYTKVPLPMDVYLTSLVHEAYSITYLRLTEAPVQVPNLNRLPHRRMPAERSATTPTKRIYRELVCLNTITICGYPRARQIQPFIYPIADDDHNNILDSFPTYEIPTRSLATVLDQLLRLDACMGTTWTVGT